jgi:hypothetical protein
MVPATGVPVWYAINVKKLGAYATLRNVERGGDVLPLQCPRPQSRPRLRTVPAGGAGQDALAGTPGTMAAHIEHNMR